MRRKQKIWAGVSVLVVVASWAALTYGYDQFWRAKQGVEADDLAKPVTLAQVEAQARVDAPAGTKLAYGEFLATDNWAVAARITFAPVALPAFLTNSGLTGAVVGLRPVPPLTGPAITASGTAATDPSAPPMPPAASLDPAAPTLDVPTAPGSLISDDPGWRPQGPSRVIGFARQVREGTTRWVMIDLDRADLVTVYIYAVSATPRTSQSASSAAASAK